MTAVLLLLRRRPLLLRGFSSSQSSDRDASRSLILLTAARAVLRLSERRALFSSSSLSELWEAALRAPLWRLLFLLDNLLLCPFTFCCPPFTELNTQRDGSQLCSGRFRLNLTTWCVSRCSETHAPQEGSRIYPSFLVFTVRFAEPEQEINVQLGSPSLPDSCSSSISLCNTSRTTTNVQVRGES